MFTRARREQSANNVASLIPTRQVNQIVGSVAVTPDSALRHSAVWACLRLRANLVSSAPIDVWRAGTGGRLDSVTPPMVLTMPDGNDLPEWLWATQFDLDRFGNVMGLITLRDGLGLPYRIEPWDTSAVNVITRNRKITGYRYDNVRYDPADVWHERQYVVPGLPMGLSPLAYAAWSIGGYLSAQQFALNWFGSGAQPSGVLKNIEDDQVSIETREEAKRRFRESTRDGDIFVTGSDWEWTPSTVTSQTAAFLDEMKYGIADICRFFDVPGDLIGAETSTGSITYASQSQRMVELLVTSLGPVFHRRQTTLSHVLPARQNCTFRTDYLLRMDPETRSKVINGQVLSRLRAPSEQRALDNLMPYTAAQIAEFDILAVPLAKMKTGGASE
jgi:HK97 family phage portal protein